MAKLLKISLSLLLLYTLQSTSAQENRTIINGKVLDSSGAPVSNVNITLDSLAAGTYTDIIGSFTLTLEADTSMHILHITSIGFRSRSVNIMAVPGTTEIVITLEEEITRLSDVIVTPGRKRDEPSMKILPIVGMVTMPASSGAIESLIKSMPGVVSGNELSNRYSVRGGSYDENLVYINGIEIEKPVLIHAGQQEGLSVINPDLTGSISFSTGGFNASYGDRMASVLEIRYREPEDFRASFSVGMMNSSAHAEGVALGGRLSLIGGIRYRSNRLLLGTLETDGSYQPLLYDLQLSARFRLTNALSLSLLTIHNVNDYTFIPVSRRSSFGNLIEAYSIFVQYEGAERDRYRSTNIAVSLDISLNNTFKSRFILHRYHNTENEKFDIRGSYSLSVLDKDRGSENMSDSIMNIGTGSWLEHARNYLDGNTTVIEHKTRWEHSDNILNWGARIKLETISDDLNEWKRIDSAGYTLPLSTGEMVLSEWAQSANELSSYRFEAYIIDNITLHPGMHDLTFTGGARVSWWSFNNELLFSPRLSVTWNPPLSGVTLYSSVGRYYQPPYYREMRRPDGSVNENIKAQSSFHFVAGTTVRFIANNVPLRLTGEIYYKNFNRLIPYKIDNVRIIYAGENSAEGVAKGIDLRLNGEFVKDAESWVSVSLMKVTHNILNDTLPAYAAPTDSRFGTTVFFQDWLPSNPTFRAHIRLHFSTGVPVSQPDGNRYDSRYRMPSYRRVDIGFSKSFSHNGTKPSGLPPFVESVTAGLEIFNLIDINNTISYSWLSTVNNLSGEVREFAVPSYLTGRMLNFKISAVFGSGKKSGGAK
ncbi:MAG: carboxypeptidase-like regulatory domain-containing protein [Bacteroidales bacterium]